jgi:hypothetical protein
MAARIPVAGSAAAGDYWIIPDRREGVADASGFAPGIAARFNSVARGDLRSERIGHPIAQAISLVAEYLIFFPYALPLRSHVLAAALYGQKPEI